MVKRDSDKESARGSVSKKVARKAVTQQAKGVAKTKSHKKPAAPAPSSPTHAPTPRASAEFVAGLADLVQVDSEEIQDLMARVTDLTARVARLEQARPPGAAPGEC